MLQMNNYKISCLSKNIIIILIFLITLILLFLFLSHCSSEMGILSMVTGPDPSIKKYI